MAAHGGQWRWPAQPTLPRGAQPPPPEEAGFDPDDEAKLVMFRFAPFALHEGQGTDSPERLEGSSSSNV